MEHLLLKVLRFDVAVPTTNVFCDRFLKEAKADPKTISLAMVYIIYLLSCCIQNIKHCLCQKVLLSVVFVGSFTSGYWPALVPPFTSHRWHCLSTFLVLKEVIARCGKM